MIRGLLSTVIVIALAYFATTLGCGSAHPTAQTGWPYAGSEGKLTFVGHVRAIWHTEEVQDAKKGIEDEAGPAARDLKKKVHEVTSDDDKDKKK